MQFRCPKCKRTDGIEVVVTQWALLMQDADDTDNIETNIYAAEDCDQEWDEQSPARCKHCRHTGVMLGFDAEVQDERSSMMHPEEAE